MNKDIIFLSPVCTHNIWGGTRLNREFGYPIEGDDIGECWGISAHPNGDGTVASGAYQGMKLSELWEKHPELFGNTGMDRFPLLIKIIDAKDDLSIQVHPDDAYAKVHENGSLGKTECWFILDCKENATLVVGHNAKTKEELEHVTAKQALNHPNWNMGAKVTIDSATMMNKGLELIEAAWLFSMPMEQLDVVVHRESIIHSLIEYQDNSVLAQLGVPDMRIPIQYAITFPQRYPSPCKQLDLTECGQLSFYKPDYDTFRCLNACRNAFMRGGLTPAATNGANEEAVKLFLQGRIDFLAIGDLVTQAMERQNPEKVTCIEDVLEADASARRFVLDTIG